MTRFALILFAGLVASATAADSAPSGLIRQDGRPAPELRLADMDGRVTDLRDLRGQWVMVHFWASWCAPCRREMPAIQKLASGESGAPVRIVMVNTAEGDDEVFAFLNIVAPALTTLMDRDGSVTAQWKPRGLPASFLVDPEGRIRYLALGGREWNEPAYNDFLRGLTGGPGQPTGSAPIRKP